jgi:hypothetical protein
MLTAVVDGRSVMARDVPRGTRGKCPECLAETTAKAGPVVRPYFAHRANRDGCWHGRETEAHRRCKTALFEALSAHPGVRRCVMEERQPGGFVPDILAEIGRERVAFEVQRSRISPADLERRSRRYFAAGIAVLWIRPEPPRHGDGPHRASQLERWCEETYGRCYYWEGGTRATGVKFGQAMRWIDEWEGCGGYWTPYKARFLLERTDALDLVDDFGTYTRHPGERLWLAHGHGEKWHFSRDDRFAAMPVA